MHASPHPKGAHSKEKHVDSAKKVYSAPPSNPLFDFLHHHKVSEILAEKKGDVVSLKATDTIEHAVKVLADNRVLSAPVHDDAGAYLGFVDTMDILKHIVNATPSVEQIKSDELNSLQIAGRAIALVQIQHVVDFSADPFVGIQKESNLGQLATSFATGLHRVGVLSPEQKLIGIVSQSDVTRFLFKHLNQGKLKVLGERSIESLGYANQHVELQTVHESKSVLHAVQTLNKKGVSAVAVVGDDGSLVGNFSASNVRGLYREKFPGFLQSVREFLNTQSPESLQPVCVLPSSTLYSAVETLVSNKLHRAWVVDDRKPVGVLSLTDIMHVVVSHDLVA